MSGERDSRRSRLEPIGAVVEAVLAELGAPTAATLETLLAGWDAIAGDVAHLTRPSSLHHGVLTVEAVTPAAAAQIRYGGARLLAALREAGVAGVEAVEVRVARRAK